MSLPAARNSQIAYLSRIIFLCTLLSSVWLVTGCGGRWRTYMEVPDDDGTAAAGGGGAAGGTGSSKAGSASTAGASGAAGSGVTACDPTTCVTPECADGSTPTLLTGDCCPSCQPICKQACDACQPGFHQETHAGDCCAACTKDTPESMAACTMGQLAYAAVRDRLAYKDSYGCASDAECVVAGSVNLCEQGSCGGTPLFYQAVDDFTQGTTAEAAVDCGMCSPFVGPTPPCVPPGMPHCFSGQCAFTQP